MVATALGISLLLVALSVCLHAIGSTLWIQWLARHLTRPDGHWRPGWALPIVIATALVLVLLHALEAALWGLAYYWLIPVPPFHRLEPALYFSLISFTTLGYGDVVLADPWRLMSGLEALCGFVLVGWTTALLFMIVQRGLPMNRHWPEWQRPTDRSD